ncbi:integrase catalytic domain-containing protein [Trichonephila clavipes]|nr:integrase catalytic domain-containing protein [Trichonephila clavipes]
MEKIVSTLGREKVLQPSSEELTVEPIPRSVALVFMVFHGGREREIIKVHPSKKNISDLVIPQGIVLADEGFNQPSEISCLIGSEHFFDIFGTKQIRVPSSNFRLIDSKFGYVKHCLLSKGWNTLDKTLCSFWETENLSEEQPIISDELSYCEKHFEKTHFRKPCGRYSVSLPFKENIQENVNLGDSRSIPSKRLDQLWRRLDRDPKLNNLYAKFIEDYLSLDHMEEITNIDDIAPEEGFFLPHHGVLRAGNRSRPLRVSPSTNHIFTKRAALSQIARIFVPLGLLGPVISKAKFFMQQLWLLKLEWHEKLPVPVAAEWASFVQSLPVWERLKIPRFVLSENLASIIIYGFCDASEKGFGAVTYVSVIKNNGDRHSQLLCSKSRVATLKTLTIPRLELSACLLLSKLIRKVINALKMNLSQVILFSDSTIALSWIKTPPHLLKTFVANRVAKIQELTVNFSWHHISSENNPADLVSRGLSVSDLINSPLWWKGPDPSIFKNDELLEDINDCEVKKEF